MITLYPHQERAINEARAACARGHRAPLIVAPTGFGKTCVGSEIARRHLAAGGLGVLWLAHRKELIEQAADTLERLGLTVGVIAASATKRVSPFARVQVASVQTLRRRSPLPQASLVVFDEAHHFVADDWGELGRAYEGAVRVGLTATPERGDGQGLGALFNAIVVAATPRELTELGYLVPCEIVSPDRPLRSAEIAQRPVDAYLGHARGRRTIVFAAHVKAARQYLDEFLAAGVRAALVHGALETFERSEIMRRYRAGEIDVLVNVYVLTEGFDDPPTSCAIIARGCTTPGIYLQMVGRILRPSPGKTTALLIDLRGVVHVHGRPDEDREYSLKGRAIQRKDDAEVKLCIVCGAAIPEGATVCPDCSRAPSELDAPAVLGLELVRYAAKRQETNDQRITTLVRWFIDAQKRGFKSGWALHKFKIVYGDWPSWAVKHAANEQLRRLA